LSWLLENASAADIDELMTWFPDAHSVDIWGGPRFRYPFDRKSFHEDCRWQEYSSFCLRNPENEFVAFGQLGTRHKRYHLVRLVVNSRFRRQGVALKLLEMIIEVARELRKCEEIALFVYKDNAAAYQCYLASGFEVRTYPDGARLADKCFYLARTVS